MDANIQSLVADFFAHYPARTYPKNQIIIFSGENPDKIFYLLSGKVCMYDITYRGDEIITNIFKPPAFFPVSLAITSNPNSFFYKAETDTVVHYAPAEDVIAFLLKHPPVMLDLLTRVYSGLDGLLGRIVQLMAGNATTRLIYELVIECRRFGKELDDGHWLLDIHESQIASRSGLSRETVSRGMKQLKEKELITVSASGIIITNLSQLSNLLAPPSS